MGLDIALLSGGQVLQHRAGVGQNGHLELPLCRLTVPDVLSADEPLAGQLLEVHGEDAAGYAQKIRQVFPTGYRRDLFQCQQ